MKTVHAWLDEYSTSHQHPANRKVHYICVPAIVLSLLCALKAVPVGNDWINPASVITVAALAYYFVLSKRLAVGLTIALALFYAVSIWLQNLTGHDFIWVAVEIFIIAWIGQFAGHYIEGARPSFFKDLQFLLIGPMWEMAHFYELLGIRVDSQVAEATQSV